MRKNDINNGVIKNKPLKRLNRQYKVVDKGKTDCSVLAHKFLPGFNKEPLVIMERFDIKPYLNHSNMYYDRLEHDTLTHFSPTTPGSTINIKSQTYQKLLDSNNFHCTVQLLREDLNNLLSIIHNSGLNLSAKDKLRVINEEYTKFYGENNNISSATLLKNMKRVSFSDKIIVHEIQEYHKCRKCSRIFNNHSNLRVHVKEEHKKKNQYVCNYCNKAFVDRSIFKIHIKLHCNLCGQFCNKKSELLTHRRDVCRIVKKYSCKNCNNSFFKFMDLKDHSYDHVEETFFICDICKEQCVNPCLLAHHIKFLHWKKRPESLYEIRNLGCDRIYLCNFCEYTSVDKELIENHVENLPDFSNRVMTGYKDYYFCDQCLKKFDKEADMLQHKWTHFLKSDSQENFLETDKKKKKVNKKRPKIKIKALKYITKDSATKATLKKKKLKLKLQTIDKLQGSSQNKASQRFYNVNKSIPLHFKPTVSLDRTIIQKYLSFRNNSTNKNIESVNSVDVKNLSEINNLKDENFDSGPTDSITQASDATNATNLAVTTKPGLSKISKKTLLSNYQCNVCQNYFSTSFCLKRHYLEVHEKVFECKKCYQLYPSKKEKLLHECCSEIDLITPDESNIDDYNISDDYIMGNVDFEIPDPIVELTEYDGYFSPDFEIPDPIVELTEYDGYFSPNRDVSSRNDENSHGMNYPAAPSPCPLGKSDPQLVKYLVDPPKDYEPRGVINTNNLEDMVSQIPAYNPGNMNGVVSFAKGPANYTPGTQNPSISADSSVCSTSSLMNVSGSVNFTNHSVNNILNSGVFKDSMNSDVSYVVNVLPLEFL